jgi:hypothetical protein
MEIWLEPVLDGTVLHYFLRADPPSGSLTPRNARREVQRRQLDAKSVSLGLKLTLEDGRPAGCPPHG